MTAYAVIADSEIDPESPGTTGLFTKLRNNPLAIQEGDATAPKIVYAALNLNNDLTQSDLGPNCVGQSELKTTSGTVGGSVSGGSDLIYTLSGGNYGLSIDAYAQDWANATHTYPLAYPNSTYSHAVQHFNSDVSTQDLFTREYYVNSSPPYDLGDGEIPLFVYLVIDNTTKEIEHYSVYVDPVWAYNGPTIITPTRYGKDGKVFRNRRDMSKLPFTHDDALKDIGKYREYIEAFKEAEIIEEEIGQELKNADMNIVPHPFMSNDLTGKTVVMLDPVSKVLEDLLEINQHDRSDVVDIIKSGYLKIGNTKLKRKSPKGLLVPSVKWK